MLTAGEGMDAKGHVTVLWSNETKLLMPSSNCLNGRAGGKLHQAPHFVMAAPIRAEIVR